MRQQIGWYGNSPFLQTRGDIEKDRATYIRRLRLLRTMFVEGNIKTEGYTEAVVRWGAAAPNEWFVSL
jgi:hypothetical protein